MKNTALITSTIAPDPGVVDLKRNNARDRLNDYLTAFHFYCECLRENIFTNIVYVDNSAWPLDDFRKIGMELELSHRIEFISYKSTTDPNNNRLYLELDLIEEAIQKSHFLSDDPRSIIWKITGRYMIKNIGRIVAACRARDGIDVYVNCRDLPFRYVDFFLAGFNLASYARIFSNNRHLYQGTLPGEIILRQYLDNENLSGIKVMRRFPVVPRVVGVRGYDGTSYSSLSGLMKFYIRCTLSAVFPKLWV